MSEADTARTLLHDSAERVLREQCPPAVVNDAEAGRWPAALWRALEDTGLTRALLPEERGGAGLGWREAADLLRLAGAHAAPVPLAETLIAGRVLAGAGLSVPDGPLGLAGTDDGLEIEGAGRGACVHGEARRVAWGRHAAFIVIVDGGGAAAVVPTDSCSITPGINLAGEPRDRLRFDRAPVAEHVEGGDVGSATLRRLGAFARAAQMAGALERALELSVHYAGERVQFGRPIARFQAVQQQLAAMAGDVAAAASAVTAAAEALDRGDGALEVAAAKVRAGEAAGAGAAVAHQVHGALGFTHEHTLHHSTRRLWSYREELGGEAAWAEWLGRELLATGSERLWKHITER